MEGRLLLLLSVLVRETAGWINSAPPAGIHANQAAAAAEVFRVNILLTSLPLPALNVAAHPSPVDTPATIRRATVSDAQRLAELCTDAFYGSHSFADGPVIFAQRAQIYQRVEAQIRRRIAIEKGRECRLLVAATASGELCGCCDIAVHLFDRRETRFELMVDQMPNDHQRYAWRPYVASLAVREADRRKGIARLLMKEAERTARRWGYRELMLEVAYCNEQALAFYRRLGYQIRGSDVSGTGATIVERRPFHWNVLPVEKFLMRKRFLL